MRSTFTIHRVSVTLMCAVATAAMVAIAAGQEPGGSRDQELVLRLFHDRVEAYAALHRRLEASLPKLEVTDDMRSVTTAREQMAAAVRAARPDARQGDIFSLDVAHLFRLLIADGLAGRDVEAFLAELNEEHPNTHALRAHVNKRLPAGATQEVPLTLLGRLPALPDDVEYRIVNHDLVLWDIHADLVIDLVSNAFVPST